MARERHRLQPRFRAQVSSGWGSKKTEAPKGAREQEEARRKGKQEKRKRERKVGGGWVQPGRGPGGNRGPAMALRAGPWAAGQQPPVPSGLRPLSGVGLA